MRAGGACGSQQTLSAEAASVLKHSLSLARRRGHAQVTPLHVAATLLSSRASVLTNACLRTQPHQPSHPLQFRALELCFNVALNRLPATPSTLLHAQPSLSNALVAALKRAQAHQRRGCIDQQPVILIKVELEQLILSILDDPSVSRVMKEAGFSSTLVKNSLEESNSISPVFRFHNPVGGIYSTPNSPPTETQKPDSFWHSHLSEKTPLVISPLNKPVNSPKPHPHSYKEDISVILEVLLGKKKRNIVVVGDMVDGLVAEFMGKMEGGDVPEELKSAHLIKLQFSSMPLRNMKREEVEMRVADLKKKVDLFASGGGVLIYTGDLKWSTGKEENVYSRVDHLVTEMAKLLSWHNNSSSKVWLLATASYHTYLECRMRQPPLDIQWFLQPVSVPYDGLGLSLNEARCHDSKSTSYPQKPSQDLDKRSFSFNKEDGILTCCQECKSNCEKEASLKSFSLHSIHKTKDNGSSPVPPWLKPSEIETDIKEEMRRKYNNLCHYFHQGSHDLNNYNPASGYESYPRRNAVHPILCPNLGNKKSIFSDAETNSSGLSSIKPTHATISVPRFRRQYPCHEELGFINGNSRKLLIEPSLDSLKVTDDKEVNITLALGNTTYAHQATSDKLEVGAELSRILQENVPWQSEKIPAILEVIGCPGAADEHKFIMIQGNDAIGKRRLATGIAQSFLGSSEFLFCLKMRQDVNGATKKREALENALKDHERLVVLIEDFESADPEFAEFLINICETGSLEKSGKDWRNAGGAIFILTIGAEESCSRENEKMDPVIQMKLYANECPPEKGSTNLVQKRKADWDVQNTSKTQRNIEFEVIVPSATDSKKGDFSKRSNMNNLDLNIKAYEDEVREGNPRGFNAHSTTLATNISNPKQGSSKIFQKVSNHFVFDRKPDQELCATEMLISKIKRCLDEVSRSRNITSFGIEKKVLQEIYRGCGFYLNSLFEQWLNEVFWMSLKTIDTKEGKPVSIRLSLGGEGGGFFSEDGFKGTSLPKRIQVSWTS